MASKMVTDPRDPDFNPYAEMDRAKLEGEIEDLEGELNFYKPMFIW